MYDIPILMLHTINNSPEKNPLGVLSVSSKGFEAYLKVFKKMEYQMISMDDLINKRYDESKPYIVLTFDDGYKDNLTVALPILKKYNAKGTIFLNPAYTSDKTDDASDWGFMTWDEIQTANDSGVFDLQAHTMTHEFIFTSDKVVDYYTANKFAKYYWLAWMLWPDSPRSWNSNAMNYRDKIPTGYPIFEYNRRLSAVKFIPSSEYVEFLIENYISGKSETKLFDGKRGVYETKEDYLAYATWEVTECKRLLEEKLEKDIHTLCFPGGGYTDEILDIAKTCGYKCYMNASRLRVGNNNNHVGDLHAGKFVGLNRTSFSLIHPGLLPDSLFDYWVAKLSLGSYQKQPFYVFVKKMLATFLH